ncbi:hypothetical protein [Paenibacillus gorillae]|uniref:hypothetical protein n=1 Tax=Paenibacillus gorillae TaxID=1243662 RepID=UPI0004B738C9|nr:hypothetical protein [Paenibacillus gorillae]
MLHKIKIIPVLLTAAATALVLFGGWLLYNKVALEAPLDKAVQGVAGIESAQAPVIDRDRVSISLTLKPDASLKQVYDAIQQNGKDVIGSKELKLNIDNAKSNDKLDKLWSTVLFDVAQAMETKAYSDIPKAMNRISEEHAGITTNTEMDENNVYITIMDGANRKYVVLPRTPVMLEVSAHA